MKRAMLLGLAVAGIVCSAQAADIAIVHPWARATAPGAQVGAGYVTLQNSGAAADKLVSATADVADHVEIHEMSMDGGVMKMRQLPTGLEIPAGKSVELKPGGFHLMLMGLKQPLKSGETIKGVMTFEKAGAVPVELKVEAMGGGAGHQH